MDDLAIVNRAQNGDLEAFEILMHHHVEAIVSYLYRFMPDKDDIDDIVQEVFLKAFCNLSRFNSAQGQFRSWLFRIATNTSLDEIKRRKRVAANREALVTHLQRETARNEWESDNELVQVSNIESAIQSLPTTQRQVVLLSYFHDLSWQEIANTLGIPIGTVKSRMSSALSRLRQLVISVEDGEIR